MRIVLVRHGLAKPKQTWKGPDTDRPLVNRGLRQADDLRAFLGPDRPTRVISSPANRCTETVAPLAREMGLDVEVSRYLGRDAGPDAWELIRGLARFEPRDSTIVACTHREVMVDLLPQMIRRSGVKLPHRPPGAKGGVWTLWYREGRLEQAAYRPPLY